jgi:hypothetical protein
VSVLEPGGPPLLSSADDVVFIGGAGGWLRFEGFGVGGCPGQPLQELGCVVLAGEIPGDDSLAQRPSARFAVGVHCLDDDSGHLAVPFQIENVVRGLPSEVRPKAYGVRAAQGGEETRAARKGTS